MQQFKHSNRAWYLAASAKVSRHLVSLKTIPGVCLPTFYLWDVNWHRLWIFSVSCFILCVSFILVSNNSYYSTSYYTTNAFKAHWSLTLGGLGTYNTKSRPVYSTISFRPCHSCLMEYTNNNNSSSNVWVTAWDPIEYPICTCTQSRNNCGFQTVAKRSSGKQLPKRSSEGLESHLSDNWHST